MNLPFPKRTPDSGKAFQIRNDRQLQFIELGIECLWDLGLEQESFNTAEIALEIFSSPD